MKIEVSNFTKDIDKYIVLNDVSLTLESGRIYGLVGKNGSGKTMFLRMIAGLIRPTTGEVRVDEKVLGERESFPTDLGILLETPKFLPQLTGYENLKILAKIKNKIDAKQIQDYMSTFDLDWKSKKKFKSYSLGMKQKLGIIQAIMENQQIIILDEPFNALDESSVKTLRALLLDLKRDNKLIVMTSHNNDDIQLLCDEIFTISEGRIVDSKQTVHV